MAILESIKNFVFPKTKTKLVYPANPELIEKDELVKQYAEKLSSMEAEFGRIKAKENEEKINNIEGEQEKDFYKKLNEQADEIKNKKYEGTISFMSIFEKFLKDKKFRNSIEISDKDGIVNYGLFGDFKILPNCWIGVTDINNNLLSAGPTLKDVIYKPQSLANQLKRKMLLLPYNKNGDKFPDIEEELVPECYYDELEDKFKWTSERRVPFKEAIAKREGELAENREYIEHLEQTNIDLKNKLRDKERALRQFTEQSEVAQTELSKALEKSIQFERKIGDMQMQVVQLTESKAINERLISGMEIVQKELLNKTEEMSLKTEFKRALELTQNMIRWSKNQIGKTVIQTQNVETEKPEKKVQPGEKIG